MTDALEQAKREQEALDWSIGYTEFTCLVCGTPGMRVRRRRLPDAGPLELDDYTLHTVTPDDVMLPFGIGDVYYHRSDTP